MSEGGEHVQVMSTPICLTISYVIALWYLLYIEDRGKTHITLFSVAHISIKRIVCILIFLRDESIKQTNNIFQTTKSATDEFKQFHSTYL